MTLDVSAAPPRLAKRLGGEGASVADAGRLSGGASMETWAFAIETAAGREDLILRRRSGPFDPENARSISLATEAALIQATGARGAPVPSVRHVCDDADGLGEAYVMGRVAGETLGKRIVSDPRFDAVRGKLARQCGEVLAQIHATPPHIRTFRPETTDPWAQFLDRLTAKDPRFRYQSAQEVLNVLEKLPI